MRKKHENERAEYQKLVNCKRCKICIMGDKKAKEEKKEQKKYSTSDD